LERKLARSTRCSAAAWGSNECYVESEIAEIFNRRTFLESTEAATTPCHLELGAIGNTEHAMEQKPIPAAVSG
jgi:hypothetical protein